MFKWEGSKQARKKRRKGNVPVIISSLKAPMVTPCFLWRVSWGPSWRRKSSLTLRIYLRPFPTNQKDFSQAFIFVVNVFKKLSLKSIPQIKLYYNIKYLLSKPTPQTFGGGPAPGQPLVQSPVWPPAEARRGQPVLLWVCVTPSVFTLIAYFVNWLLSTAECHIVPASFLSLGPRLIVFVSCF